MKRWIRKRVLRYVMAFIRGADEQEIELVMESVEQRYRLAFPTWEVVYFALPKEPSPERSRILQTAMECFTNPRQQKTDF